MVQFENTASNHLRARFARTRTSIMHNDALRSNALLSGLASKIPVSVIPDVNPGDFSSALEMARHERQRAAIFLANKLDRRVSLVPSTEFILRAVGQGLERGWFCRPPRRSEKRHNRAGLGLHVQRL
jgi:hypothetical protein